MRAKETGKSLRMSEVNRKPKVVIIGVDGASFTLLKPWIQKGLLPHFGRLLNEGVYGELKSTVPPITAPAWVSFQTGKNPGQHGIFDWLARDKNSYALRPINANSIKLKTLWEIMSEQNKRVCVINVPVTYPPKKVNGFLVSGMLTPSKRNEFTYPAGLKAELNKYCKDYEIMPRQRFESKKINIWIDGLKHTVAKRKELAIYLLKKHEWDFFMTHFIETDLVQHRMWQGLSNQEDNPILEIYKEIDKSIGEIVSMLTDDTSILIMSDHGFGPLYYNIYINNWLLKEGYLKLKRDIPTRLKMLMYKCNITPAAVYKLLAKLGLLNKGLTLGKGQRYNLISKFFLSAGNIDWKSTKAYSSGNMGQVYINTQGREPEGCVTAEEKPKLVDDIVSKLNCVLHHRTGERLFDRIYKKDEIYSGCELYNAPEILVMSEGMETMAVGMSEFVSNKVIEPSFAFTGGHRMEGIFIAFGKNFKKGLEIKNAKIIDLAPTVLYSMGLAVPDDMDGEVLSKIFTDEYLTHNKIILQSSGKSKNGISDEPDFDKDETEIRDRLKNLGYV